jgi:membrane protein required for colicin V production
MSSFDVVLLIVLGVFAFSGWRKGLLKKVISVASLVVAIFLATKYSAVLGRTFLTSMGVSGGVATVVSYLLIVCAVLLVQGILYRIFVKNLAEGLWNKITGAIFGILEAALLMSVLFLFLGTYFHYPSEDTREDSFLFPPIKSFAPFVMDCFTTLVPEAEDIYHDTLQPPPDKNKEPEK